MSQIPIDFREIDINALVGRDPAYCWGRKAVRFASMTAVAIAGLLWLAGVVR